MSTSAISPEIAKFQTAPGIAEVRGSFAKRLRLLALGILMTGLSAFVIYLPHANLNDNSIFSIPAFAYAVGGVGFIFFGCATLIIASRLLKHDQVAYRLTADDLWIGLGWRPRTLPWRLVRKVGTYQMQSTRMVTLEISEQDYLALNTSAMERKAFALNTRLVGYPCLIIAAQGTNASHEELLALVSFYAQKYSPYLRKQDAAQI